MRFMVMVKATKDSEAGVMPSEELLEAMGKFNEEMVKAGVIEIRQLFELDDFGDSEALDRHRRLDAQLAKK
jgi:hypothetical protein